jgi:protoporphyrinogen oxidase
VKATTIGILGGGLTGLTLGSLLPESEILEKEEAVGGLCRSKTDEGFTYDIGGSHVLFSRNKETMKWIEKMLGENVESTVRNTKVFFKGRYVKYPFENGLHQLPVEDNFECLKGYIESYYARQTGESPRPQNFEQWMYYRFGKGITEKYLLPYNEKIWKIGAKEMGLKWIEGRIPDPPIEDIVKSSLGIETEGYKHQLNFLYPRTGGIQALTDRIAESCGSTRTGFQVRQISKEGDEFLVSDSESQRSYSKLVSTIPLPYLIKCLEDTPKEVERAAGELQYNSLISVFLGMSSPKTKDYSWVYFPDEDSLFHRVSFPSNYSPKVAPKGHCSLLAEITCHKGDKIWRMSDKELVEHAVERLDKLEVIRKGDVVFSDVSRMTPAYIIYDLEFEKNIETVRDFVKEQGIEICGRFGEFQYLNMDSCIEKAISLAKRIK